jgi:ATP-dependent RNA helicase RhlE
VRHLPAGRQTLLFSATMPDDVRELTREIQNNPVRVQIDPSAPADTVSHTFYPVEPAAKNAMLKTILNRIPAGSVLVFTRTKHRSKSLARQLEKSGYDAAALHGNLSQNQRQKALEGFRNGRHKILVATDVAARGIDVCGISHVINYDIPDTADAYTHRTGRTGRARQTGDAFTFVSHKDKDPLRSIAKVLGGKVTYAAPEGTDGGAEPSEKKPTRQRTANGVATPTAARTTETGRRHQPQKAALRKKSRGADARRSSKGNGTLGVDLIMSLAGNPSSAA